VLQPFIHQVYQKLGLVIWATYLVLMEPTRELVFLLKPQGLGPPPAKVRRLVQPVPSTWILINRYQFVCQNGLVIAATESIGSVPQRSITAGDV
jgi:hypothetical protein